MIELFPLLDLLVPFFETISERRTFLRETLGAHSPLLNDIVWEGEPREFLSAMLVVLVQDENTLDALLDVAKARVSVTVAEKIEMLRPELHAWASAEVDRAEIGGPPLLAGGKCVFISYSRADEAFAELLEKRLRALNLYDVRRDRRTLDAGEDWWQQLQKEIKEADSVILCLSPSSLASEMVRGEWRYAKSVGTRVLPVAAAVLDYSKLPRWLSRVHIPDLREDAPGSSQSWQGLLKTLNTSYTPYVAVFMGDAPRHFVMRPVEYNAIKAALIDEKRATNGTIGVIGGGGFGKTTLVQALAHDDDVRDWFYDGILWTTLGESADANTIKNVTRTLIGLLKGDPPVGDDWDAMKQALRMAIGSRYMLIIIDDTWMSLYLQMFDMVGENCVVLVTTRKRTVLAEEAQTYDIDIMRASEAGTLLTTGVDEALARLEPPQLPLTIDQRTDLIALGELFKGYALLLTLARAALIGHIRREKRIDKAFAELKADYADLGVLAWDINEEAVRTRAVGISIDASLKPGNGLTTEQVERVIALSVFKNASDIPLTTLMHWWGEVSLRATKRFAALLHDSSLVDYNAPSETIRLHDVIRQVLAAKVADMPSLHTRLVTDTWSDPFTLPDDYAWRNYAYHLFNAGNMNRLRGLLLDFRFLQVKLKATDANALIADCALLPADEPVQLVRSTLEMSAHVLVDAPDQLPIHLHGRLYRHADQPEIAALRIQAGALVPLLPIDNGFDVLMPAGGALLATLSGHSGEPGGALELRDGTLLSWSHDRTLIQWTPGGSPLRVLAGHTSAVFGALVLKDGRLFSWSHDKTLRLWRVDGSEITTLNGHTEGVQGALEMRDGRLLSWSYDKTLRLWTADGSALATLSGHTHSVNGASELSDGRLLSWSWEEIQLWGNDGTLHSVLTGHTNSIGGALVLRNGLLLSWSKDYTLRVWTAHGQEMGMLTGHTDEVNGALELSDGRILSWSEDKTLRLWSKDTSPLTAMAGHTQGGIGALELSDGRLLSWSHDKTLRLWTADGSALATLSGHTHYVSGALELSDGRLLSWSADRTLRLWSADGSSLTVLIGHYGPVRGLLALTADRLLSWTGSLLPSPFFSSHTTDTRLLMWAVDRSPLTIATGHEAPVIEMIVLSDGRFLSRGGESKGFWRDSPLRLWGSNGTPGLILEGHKQQVSGALELRDGRLLSWSYDHTLRLWTADGRVLATLSGHEAGVIGALELHDGRLLSWVESPNSEFTTDESLRLWAANGSALATLHGHKGGIYKALELHDGRLLSWSDNGSLWLWAADGSAGHMLSGHTDDLNGALEMDDGTLLSWSKDRTLRCWGGDGTPLAIMTGHTNNVIGALQLDDGTLVSWSADGTLRRWGRDGATLAVITGHKGRVEGVQALDDGTLLSWSNDKKLRRQRRNGEVLAVLEIKSEDKNEWDRLVVFAWARAQGFNANILFNDPVVTGGRAARRHNEVYVYNDHDGRRLARFVGDARISCLAVSGNVIAAGDTTGRVIFLRWQPSV